MTPTIRADDPLASERTRIRSLPWRKSTRSGGSDNDCVELAYDDEKDDLLIRDTKQTWDEGPILRVSFNELEAIKSTLHA